MNTKKLTVKAVKAELATLGLCIRKTSAGDFQVIWAGGRSRLVWGDNGYFTADLGDALMTGRAMAKERQARNVTTDSRETFAQYLARVGQDHAKAGAEFTAEDYAKAAARIAKLESVCADMALKLDEVITSKNMGPAPEMEKSMIRGARDWMRAMTADRNVYLHLES